MRHTGFRRMCLIMIVFLESEVASENGEVQNKYITTEFNLKHLLPLELLIFFKFFEMRRKIKGIDNGLSNLIRN